MKEKKEFIACRCIVMLALIGIILSFFACANAVADEYNPQEAGHPLRIIAYILHPVGVLLDYGLMRPAHWLVHKEPLNVIFGHESEIPTADMGK